MITPWERAFNTIKMVPAEAVFAPLWSVLYIMMFASVIIISTKTQENQRNIAISLFLSQFTLKILWGYVFFETHKAIAAFIIICFLYFFLAATIAYFYKYSKLAAILLFPYFICLNIAAYLNFRLIFVS